METPCSHSCCEACSAEFLCYCLRITEEMVREATHRFGLQTVQEVRLHTGAGEGCTACHYRIRMVLDEVAQLVSEPMFSAR